MDSPASTIIYILLLVPRKPRNQQYKVETVFWDTMYLMFDKSNKLILSMVIFKHPVLIFQEQKVVNPQIFLFPVKFTSLGSWYLLSNNFWRTFCVFSQCTHGCSPFSWTCCLFHFSCLWPFNHLGRMQKMHNSWSYMIIFEDESNSTFFPHKGSHKFHTNSNDARQGLESFLFNLNLK